MTDNMDPDNMDPDNMDPDNMDPDTMDPDNMDPDNMDPDNMDPTPVGLPTPMSTSIASYYVHLNFDSGHAAQYY